MAKKKQGSLIDGVRAVCRDLTGKDAGWKSLLAHHGLDLLAADLHKELTRELPAIDRTLPGFEDFAVEGRRGIEPGIPCYSLLYHAVASPRVTKDPDGKDLSAFPTLDQLELIENYVFGVKAPSIQDLRVHADDVPLAIAVFASEYRPAIGTVHQKHADMCFSRTGIARVGTHGEHYDPPSRAYLPGDAREPHAMRVLPCRYGAYVAMQLRGDWDSFGPLRPDSLRAPHAKKRGASNPDRKDSARDFWVPLHKLFSGRECIRGQELDVRLAARHQNEKLRRIHLAFRAHGHDGGWHEPDISNPPFIMTNGLASLAPLPGGAAMVVPMPHDPMVEAATYQDRPLTYVVPRSQSNLASSLELAARGDAHHAPEYVHARHQVDKHGQVTNLNSLPNVAGRVAKGGYNAQHYLDFTADGWIMVECEALALELPRRIAAYSLIAPPDFFPFVKQQDLMDWWNQSVPPDIKDSIWPDNPGPPLPLSDVRLPANLSLPQARFSDADETVTAIVSRRGAGGDRATQIDRRQPRVSSLPDRAAGVFAPGWDCSTDRTPKRPAGAKGPRPGRLHLAAYGLGSPFPEDAKLCAALSAYWPAAAPDVTRSFEPAAGGLDYAVTTPLPDSVIGLTGKKPWDGIAGPVLSTAYPGEVEFSALAYGDWVEAALRNRFSFQTIAGTPSGQYEARTLAMARVYQVLGAKTTKQKSAWCVLSFSPAEDHAVERDRAVKAAGKPLTRGAFRFVVFEHGRKRVHPQRFDRILVRYKKLITLFADPNLVLTDGGVGVWESHEFTL
jgi:hypothetical protein